MSHSTEALSPPLVAQAALGLPILCFCLLSTGSHHPAQHIDLKPMLCFVSKGELFVNKTKQTQQQTSKQGQKAANLCKASPATCRSISGLQGKRESAAVCSQQTWWCWRCPQNSHPPFLPAHSTCLPQGFGLVCKRQSFSPVIGEYLSLELLNSYHMLFKDGTRRRQRLSTTILFCW